MKLPEYSSYDGLGLARLVARGEVTPLELVDAAIERIEALNPRLNAVVHRAFDEARDSARGPLPAAPFAGVPFLIKDLGQSVAGWPRTSGSRFLKDEVTPTDSELVRRFRAAGLLLLGKTNTPEYGITGTTESRLLGPCRTPWDPEHISGGSSGGAAAAVASGMVPVAHASDGLGSIRIPAACCGLFGLKITRDRNPAFPIDVDRVIGFNVDHVVSRSVRDSAAMLDLTGYPEAASPYAAPAKTRPYLVEVGAPPGKLRIAFSTELASGATVDPEIRAKIEETAKLLASLGHEVFERDLAIDWRRLYGAQRSLSTANFAAQMREVILARGREPEQDELEPNTWAALLIGRSVSGEDTMRGFRTLRAMGREILSFFEDVDVLMTPMRAGPLPRIGELGPDQDPRDLNRKQARALPFTPPFNFTGQPAMSVPLHHTADGLPLGIQFAGRYGDEATLFRLAAQLERALPWAERTPAIHA